MISSLATPVIPNAPIAMKTRSGGNSNLNPLITSEKVNPKGVKEIAKTEASVKRVNPATIKIEVFSMME